MLPTRLENLENRKNLTKFEKDFGAKKELLIISRGFLTKVYEDFTLLQKRQENLENRQILTKAEKDFFLLCYKRDEKMDEF